MGESFLTERRPGLSDEFEDELERQEEEKEELKSAEQAVKSFQQFIRARSCLFLNNEDHEVLHGRVTGLIKEMEMVVIRDLRPGRERLRVSQMVLLDNILYICTSKGMGQCKNCLYYEDLKIPEDRGEGDDEPETAPGDQAGNGLRKKKEVR